MVMINDVALLVFSEPWMKSEINQNYK